MKVLALLAAAAMLVASCVTPVEPTKPKRQAVDEELDRLAGTWVLVGGYLDGKPVSEEDVKKSTITWTGDTIRTSSPHITGAVIVATITVDPTTTPRQMDIVYEGARPTPIGLAIYEWLGPDRYRIAIDRRGQTRPVEFVSEPGTGQTLHVWQRQK
jgi:uncharacterized protein (TIGR03067 family)